MAQQTSTWEAVTKTVLKERLNECGVAPSNLIGPHRDGSYTLRFLHAPIWDESAILRSLRSVLGIHVRVTMETPIPRPGGVLSLVVTVGFPYGYVLPGREAE